MSEEKQLEGIGGWLIIIAIGIVLTPIRVVYNMWLVYPQIFSDGTWETLTTQGTPSYHPFWGPILVCEIGINTLLIVAWLFMAYLFFSKKKMFPKMYIFMMLFSLVFIVLDAFAIKIVIPDMAIFDPETTKEVFRSVIGVAIWVPYMLVSKRVRNTFVR